MFGSDRTSTATGTMGRSGGGNVVDWPAEAEHEARPRHARAAVDRWVDEQMFEEDVRAALQMMRPNRQERLLGWAEHRTGGSDFRVTVSWDPAVEAAPSPSSPSLAEHEAALSVPRMSDVIASLLIGSARADADVSADQECDAYLAVLGEVARRVEELRGTFA